MKYFVALAFAIALFAQNSRAQSPAIGVVVMHGKGGSPTKWVAPLASGLEQKGYLVANLEMPWSGNRHAIAPGGNVASPVYAKEVGGSVERARKLVAEGKGSEKESFEDFEGSRDNFRVSATAAAYLSWFDPAGAMNQVKSSKSIDPKVPVLFVAPTRDYPALQRVKGMMFATLPKNPLTRMVEPSASHLEAPAASIDEIARWTKEVAAAPGN